MSLRSSLLQSLVLSSVFLVIPPRVFAGLPPIENRPPQVGQPPAIRGEIPDDPYLPPAEPGSPSSGGPRSPRDPTQGVQVNVNDLGENFPGDAANEPSIAVDPANPSNIVIGWRQFDNVASNFRQAGYAYSHDAGRHWTFPGVLESGVFRSDPALECDPDGVFFYYSLNGSTMTCQMFKSIDQGVTWTGPVQARGGDKNWIAIDQTAGIGRGNIYCDWTSSFTRSTDHGATFSQPIGVSGYWGTMAVGPDGDLYLGLASGSGFICRKSTNAKDPAVTASFNPAVSVNLGGSITYDGTPNPGGLLGQCWIDVDRSDGSRRGWVYMLCSVDRPGSDPADVMFVRSTNGGLTWSAPVRVNDDAPTTNAWQWFGTMAVAPNGRIDVIWNDTRGSGTGTISRVYYSASADGGSTWSANVALTPPFNSIIGWPQQNKIGDYYDMVSDKVGANLAYAATFNGEQDVWFLRIGDYDCNGNAIGDAQDLSTGASTDLNDNGIPDECDGLGDLNCDGLFNALDIGAFVVAVLDPAAYGQLYPTCTRQHADVNGDGLIDTLDLAPFVLRLLH